MSPTVPPNLLNLSDRAASWLWPTGARVTGNFLPDGDLGWAEVRLVVLDAADMEFSRRLRTATALRIPVLASGEGEARPEWYEMGLTDFIAPSAAHVERVEKWWRLGAVAIDSRAIDVLRSLSPDQANSFLAELVEIFRQEIASGVRDLRAQLDHRREFTRTVHAMKSSAGNLGAARVQRLAEYLEQSAPETSIPHLQAMIKILDREYQTALTELEHILRT